MKNKFTCYEENLVFIVGTSFMYMQGKCKLGCERWCFRRERGVCVKRATDRNFVEGRIANAIQRANTISENGN